MCQCPVVCRSVCVSVQLSVWSVCVSVQLSVWSVCVSVQLSYGQCVAGMRWWRREPPPWEPRPCVSPSNSRSQSQPATGASAPAAPRNLSSTHCLVAATESVLPPVSVYMSVLPPVSVYCSLTKKSVEDIAFKYLELEIVMCDHCGQLVQCLPKLNP